MPPDDIFNRFTREAIHDYLRSPTGEREVDKMLADRLQELSHGAVVSETTFKTYAKSIDSDGALLKKLVFGSFAFTFAIAVLFFTVAFYLHSDLKDYIEKNITQKIDRLEDR
ncbi:MAG: hypothetical protein Q8O94_02775 [bacterium]|nr:hypothetical protein [bacterium]